MLFDEDELPNAKRVNNVPEVEDFQSARVRTDEQPVGTLLTHIGGMRWIPRLYLSQVKGKDEEQSSYQGSLRPINRQYKVIHNIELKVQQAAPNNPSIDNQNQEITARGTCRAYPNTVIPVPGDMIIAETADGRQAIYQVCDNVTPMSLFKRTAYEFEYVMYAWWTESLEKEMLKGSVENYHFVRDNIDAGINPLIADADWGVWKALEKIEANFPMKFVTRFLSREFNTFIIPGQATTIYDPFHATFCNLLFKPRGAGLFGGANIMPVDDGSNAVRLSIHSAVLTLNDSMVDEVLQIIPIITARAFLAEPYLGGVRFGGTNFVVWPPEDTSLLHTGNSNPQQSLALQTGVYSPPKARKKDSETFLRDDEGNVVPNETNEPVVRLFTPVASDKFYIFPEAFYAHDEGHMSLLETMLWATLEKNVVNPKDLLCMFNESESWSVLDQFYLQPFLYAMLPAAFRGV